MNITMWRLVVFVLMLSPTYVVRFLVFKKIPTTLFEILIFILVCVTCIRAVHYPAVRMNYRKKIKLIPRSIFFASAIFVIAGIISVCISLDTHAALGIFKAYIVDALLCGFIVWLHLETEEQLFELAVGFSISLFIISVIGIIQKCTGWGIPNPFWQAAATRRITSIFGYPNAVGLYAELLIPFVCALFVHTKQIFMRVWCVLVLLCAIAAIIFAESSGTIAALGGTTVFLLLIQRRTRIATLIVCCTLVGILFVSPYKKQFADEFLLQGFSGRLRTQMWKETVVMLRERPVFGAGLASYQKRVKPFHVFTWAEIYLYPHNLFLTMWSELGLLGVISFVWIFCLVILWSVRAMCLDKKKYMSAVVLASCSILFIHGLVDVPYFKNDLSVLFWMIVAIALWLRYTKSNAHAI